MKLRIILFLIALPTAILAQSNYHSGYVLKNNGDTLKGFIDYREWIKSPKSISFKVNTGEKSVQYFNPQTIKKFEISGLETYVSYLGLISTNGTQLSNLPWGLDTSKKTDTIFLKQVVIGNRLKLFYHNDELKTRFFISEADEVPVELKYYTYYNNGNQVSEVDLYKGQLLLYINKFAPGNDRLAGEVDRAQYEQSDLERLVGQLNNNNGVYVKKNGVARFFAGIGVNHAITEVNDFEDNGLTQHSTTISPKISAGIDIFANPNTQRLVLRAEISVFYVAPQLRYPVAINNVNTFEVYSFNQYTAAITPQILFNIYNKDNLKFYIDGGLALNLSTYSNNKATVQSTDASVVSAYSVQNPYNLEPFWANFPIQAGVIINKRTEISLTYIGYTAYTRYAGFSASNQTLGLGIKFLLGK